jgi:peptide deformylase
MNVFHGPDSSGRASEAAVILKVARMGHPVLRARAEEVTPAELSSGSIAALVADMEDTMMEYDGVGLAAPQVHVGKRVAVVEVPPEARHEGDAGFPSTAMVNPVVTPLTREEMQTWEGCLSIPELIGLVPRPRRVSVEWTGLDGERHAAEVAGFAAAAIQHEVDHLDGVLYVDRIRDLRTFQFTREFARFGRRRATG